eukprot:351585-Chlamydomonas_euryale.AAC.10
MRWGRSQRARTRPIARRSARRRGCTELPARRSADREGVASAGGCGEHKSAVLAEHMKARQAPHGASMVYARRVCFCEHDAQQLYFGSCEGMVVVQCAINSAHYSRPYQPSWTL